MFTPLTSDKNANTSHLVVVFFWNRALSGHVILLFFMFNCVCLGIVQAGFYFNFFFPCSFCFCCIKEFRTNKTKNLAYPLLVLSLTTSSMFK